ncbi:hypothetical protein GETHLI_26380 [Geothrix limicola]|uniref:eCIS core domain-containing protein n=1 Tax=Geothrix limicola TaxID=2927978 RepID=A0ABQ5QI99_9BACT|nr:DUF4157 domain-containing protein [Geothrix limicola]GLH74136.1 hypothetical protein GETHLI_26380 [Geothrix limicola]
MNGTTLQSSAQPAKKVSQTFLPGRLLQRQCDCGTHSPGGGACEACQKKKLQRSPERGSSGTTAAPGLVHDVLSRPGQPLDPATRAFMEPRFGQDFSRVRVHADAGAAASAREVGARAYTVGRHIVFGPGGFSPASPGGRELLAHELTHVVQQGPGRDLEAGAELSVDPSPAAEQEAQAVSARIMSPEAASPAAVRPSPAGIQRMPLALQRSLGDGECTSKGVPCATGDACAKPDKEPAAALGQSTAWTLTVNIDTEASSWENALRTTSFGHAFVHFSENSGREFSYGFYPAGAVPNENVRSVPGCVHHPDTTHDRCTDRKVTYSLTQPQYTAALTVAQNQCRSPRNYGQTFTCATFATEVAQAAGQSIPSARSEPTTVFYQEVPGVDNPNTLQDNVDAEVEKDPKKKGFWNSATPPPLRLQPVEPIALDGDPNAPVFKLDWLPVDGATLRWRLYDSQDRHYLMRGAEGDQDALDFLDFTANKSAIIGRKTRDLLKQRGVSAGRVQCSVRFPVKGWTDQVLTLPVSFV